MQVSTNYRVNLYEQGEKTEHKVTGIAVPPRAISS